MQPVEAELEISLRTLCKWWMSLAIYRAATRSEDPPGTHPSPGAKGSQLHEDSSSASVPTMPFDLPDPVSGAIGGSFRDCRRSLCLLS